MARTSAVRTFTATESAEATEGIPEVEPVEAEASEASEVSEVLEATESTGQIDLITSGFTTDTSDLIDEGTGYAEKLKAIVNGQADLLIQLLGIPGMDRVIAKHFKQIEKEAVGKAWFEKCQHLANQRQFIGNQLIRKMLKAS